MGLLRDMKAADVVSLTLSLSAAALSGYVLLDQGVFVAVLPACPCQKVRVVMWVRVGLLQPLATTQQPAQVVLSEQSDKSDITELTIRLIRVCQSVPKLAPRLQLLE